MGSSSELLVKTVTSNKRKLLKRLNQKVRGQIMCVNGVHDDTRSSSGRKVDPKSAIGQVGERGKPLVLCVSRNQTVRKGDSTGGKGCGRKRTLHGNSGDRGSKFALTRKGADFPQVSDLLR